MKCGPSIVVPAAERRRFLRDSAAGAALLLAGCATGREGSSESDSENPSDEAKVTPGEDLMQEHGVLERVLLVYVEVARRIDAAVDFDPAVVTSAAGVVKRFVEEYHEQNEEHYVFPRLEAAKREVETVKTLLVQHQRGRAVTDDILRLAKSRSSAELAKALRSFERMYRPHAAREDTVVFPAFREVVGRKAYAEFGEQFEDQEHEKFGEHGFEDTVAEVARLEVTLGIHDLASFTP